MHTVTIFGSERTILFCTCEEDEATATIIAREMKNNGLHIPEDICKLIEEFQGKTVVCKEHLYSSMGIKFPYRKHGTSRNLHYGLIAEEVEDVNPVHCNELKNQEINQELLARIIALEECIRRISS